MRVAFNKHHMLSTSRKRVLEDGKGPSAERPVVSCVDDVGKVAASGGFVTCRVSLFFDAMEHRRNNNNDALHISILRIPLFRVHLGRLDQLVKPGQASYSLGPVLAHCINFLDLCHRVPMTPLAIQPRAS